MALHRLSGEIHQAIVEFIDTGRPFAVATVLKASGSTPREAGTKAIIDARGDLWGTIGGGQMEAEVQRLAVGAISAERIVVKEFRFKGNDPAGADPVCGGTMRVLIDPTAATHRAAYARAAEALRQRTRGTLVTRVDSGEGPQVTVEYLDDQNPSGVPGERDAGVATTAEPAMTREAGEGEVLIEPLIPNPLLLIAGGGHVGQGLARQASLVGFDCLVIDDRPEFTNASLFPTEVQTCCGQFAEVINELPVTADVYIALVGRGHLVDAKALAACIGKPAGYIGMMGSRRKVALLRKEFIETGMATAQQFDQVHAPIGLEIKAESVPEIAVSIVAELIAVRRGAARRGRSPVNPLDPPPHRV